MEVMDKFGVEISEVEREKVASDSPRQTCPVCGTELAKDSNVPLCPRHGSQPFEGGTP